MTKEEAREEIQDHLSWRLLKGKDMFPEKDEIVIRVEIPNEELSKGNHEFKSYTIKDLINIVYGTDE